MFVRMV